MTEFKAKNKDESKDGSIKEGSDSWQEYLQTHTQADPRQSSARHGRRAPCLTILWHTNPYRIGERKLVAESDGDPPLCVSRAEPEFRAPKGGPKRPLADPHLSRKGIYFSVGADGEIELDVSRTSTVVEANCREVDQRIVFSQQAVDEGVVLLLANCLVLLLHRVDASALSVPDMGLIGQSAEMIRVRRQIIRVADLTSPVLLRGESGTGKELVATAIYKTGARQTKPFLSVNMGAIPLTLAAAELFGAARGAYSGADTHRQGYFQRADTGTLFLDEIGETSLETQSLLLRALETGEIQRVGSTDAKKVDVRVIAATDSDLESAINKGSFRASLFHRLGSFEIKLPALRYRREDFGRLFLHFIQQERRACGEHELTDPGPRGQPWMSASVVAHLAVYDWPGNVRQLRNIVRQLTINSRGSETATLDERIEQLIQRVDRDIDRRNHPPELPGEAAAGPAPKPTGQREPWEIEEEELLAVLSAQRWNLTSTADILGISRPSLYKLINQCNKIRKAADLSREEIQLCFQQTEGNLDAMVDALKVSKRGLQIRMKELGLR